MADRTAHKGAGRDRRAQRLSGKPGMAGDGTGEEGDAPP